MKPAVVSVITPSFNQAAFLEQTLQSVFTQSYPAIECIVIDGGSTDRSVEIIRKYEDRLAFWVSEKDAGQADGINKGFAKATGKYATWLNSDDVLYPHAIATTVRFLEANPGVDFIYGDVEQGYDGGPKYVSRGRPVSFSEMVRTIDVPIPQQGCLWRREAVERLGRLDPRWEVVLDREFFLRTAEHCQIHYLPGILGFFRQHVSAKSVALRARWIEELPALYSEFFARPDLKPEIKALRREAMGTLGLQCAVLSIRNRQFDRALHFLLAAMASDPLLPFHPGCRNMMRRFITRH